MKRIILPFAIFLFILLSNYYPKAFAVSPSPSPTAKLSPTSASIISPTSTEVIEKLKKIEELKEKIATKVAEIREKEKSAVSGIVKKIEKNSITLSKASGEQTVAYSEDTVFYSLKSGSKQEIKASTIKEKDTVTIFGYFDQSKTSFSAKYVYLEDLPLHVRGKVSDIDKANFTITVKEKQGNVVVDVETYTKTSIYDRNKKSFASGGFSKIKLGDTVHILGMANPKTENRMSAKKLYVISFPDQPTVAVSPTDKPGIPSATVTGKSKK